MTQPFPYAFGRLETPLNTPVGNRIAVPLENPTLPPWIPPLDWTTVTSVYFVVTRQLDASISTWTASALTTVTTAGLVAVYTFAAGDTYIACPYTLRPYAVTPGLVIPQPTVTLYVVSP
jgi:hypothetical protein